MRHILNGDAMVESFEHAAIPGERVVWREALIDGPVALDMSSPRSCADRAHALTHLYGIDTGEFAADFARREAFLAASHDGELVLWFEADSFCELALIDLLGRTRDRPGLAVSVVHPPTLALGPESLRTWFERRESVSIDARSEARELWRRYCEPDPREFVAARVADPWLAVIAADLIRDFVGRFPDARGLSRFDAALLERLTTGPSSPSELFELTRSDPELARLGLGDLQVWVRIDDLAERGLLALAEPLPKLDGLAPVVLATATITVTTLGRAALAGSRVAPPPRASIANADPSAWRRHGDRLAR